MKIDWKRKLTSRKLWVALAGFIAGLIVAFGGSSETAETVSGCILSGAAVVGYVIGEGLADSSHSKEDSDDGDNL
nr:MAG TPA: holin [Caudoviricetes sp.]